MNGGKGWKYGIIHTSSALFRYEVSFQMHKVVNQKENIYIAKLYVSLNNSQFLTV